MPKPARTRQSPPPSDLPSFDFGPGTHLLPDEDPAAYQDLSDELFEEFSPQTTYQAHLVVDLVDIQWDIKRHRRLLAATLNREFREQARSLSIQGASKLAKAGFPSEREQPDLGEELLAAEVERRHKAELRLAALKVTRSELTAVAHEMASEQIRWHERQIADLERRRRLLLADVQALRERQNAKRVIPDAEIVE